MAAGHVEGDHEVLVISPLLSLWLNKLVEPLRNNGMGRGGGCNKSLVAAVSSFCARRGRLARRGGGGCKLCRGSDDLLMPSPDESRVAAANSTRKS